MDEIASAELKCKAGTFYYNQPSAGDAPRTAPGEALDLPKLPRKNKN